MKCLYCDFEAHDLGKQEESDEMDAHLMKCHPETCVNSGEVIALIALHLQYSIPPKEIVSKFFEMRSALSDEYRKRAIKERFNRSET